MVGEMVQSRGGLVTLVCPFCRGPLAPEGSGLWCGSCGDRYERATTGQLDLRLKRPKRVTSENEVWAQRRLDHYDKRLFGPKSPPNRAATLALDNPRWTRGSRLTPTIMSHFPEPTRHGAALLDIGCGDGAFASLVERLGFAYTGADFADPLAPVLADARALPFDNSSFDVVLAIGVLEHVEQPDLSAAEAFRVLRPGGHIVGEVAFAEPFHDNSYFHHSTLGIASLLERNGFELELLSPHTTWTVLKAHTLMCLLHGMPWAIARLFVAPLQIAHRLWWKAAHAARQDDDTAELSRLVRTCGGVGYVARKPR